MSTALGRGTLAVALTSLITSIPILIDVFLQHGLADRLAVPLTCLVAMTALAAVCGFRPSTAARVVYLSVGGFIAFVYTVSVLSADPSLNSNAQYLANRVGFILVLIAVSSATPVVGVLWIVGGFSTAMAVAVLASLFLGIRVDPGFAPVIALTVALAGFLAVKLENRSRALMVPDLARLEEETRLLALESQFEQRAAAIVHDTVLGDLAAVMSSPDEIDDRMRAKLLADVTTLADPSWLSDSSSFEPTVPVDSELRIALGSLAMEYQWRGLTVNTSGNYASVVGIEPAAATALVAAIRASLENVVRHAKCESADLVFDSSEHRLTAMVVDSGIGFDPANVAHDRLGIRGSIVGRIEEHGGTVKVWSREGAGTSVVITLPTAGSGEGSND